MSAPHAAIKAKVAQRPTESVSLGAAGLIIAGIVSKSLHVDNDEAVILVTATLGALPGVVTYLVGLVRGDH